MKSAEEEWLEDRAVPFLKDAGLKPGQTILDFGSGKGMYAIPAARIVGPKGRVYAVDKDKEALAKLKKRAKKEKLKNIQTRYVKENGKIPIPHGSADVVLLYDALHRGYFPEEIQRRKVLKRIRRTLKPRGILSCYPTHLKQYGTTFKQVIGEIKRSGFTFRRKIRRKVLHDGKLVWGYVFRFTRK